MTITGPVSIELTGVPPSPTTSRVFDCGIVVYNGVTLIFAGATAGAQNLIRGSNSFYSIRNTISPQTFLFVAGTTTIFTDNFELNGTAGKNIIITSQGTPSGQSNAPNFAKPSGLVVCSYATISQNNAGYTGGPATGLHLFGKLALVQSGQARQRDGVYPLEQRVSSPSFIHKENKHAYL